MNSDHRSNIIGAVIIAALGTFIGGYALEYFKPTATKPEAAHITTPTVSPKSIQIENSRASETGPQSTQQSTPHSVKSSVEPAKLTVDLSEFSKKNPAGTPIAAITHIPEKQKSTRTLKETAHQELEKLIASRRLGSKWAFDQKWKTLLRRQRIFIYYSHNRQEDAVELVYRLSLLGASVKHELALKDEISSKTEEIEFGVGKDAVAKTIQFAFADVQLLELGPTSPSGRQIEVCLK